MLRKLLIASAILCQLTSFAQQKKAVPLVAPKIDYDHIGAPMPGMVVVTLDTLHGKALKKARKPKNKQFFVTSTGAKGYTDKQLKNDANLLVMMFNPTCGHCEDQTDLFIKNLNLFKESKLVLLANKEMKVYLPNFNNTHHVNDHADIMILGFDSTDFIKNTFLYQALPQINIYNKDRVLIKTYTGNVSIDTLMQYIQ